MADDTPIEKVPEPARGNAAYERRKALIRTAVPEGGQDAQTLLAVTATDTRPDSAFIGLKEKKLRKKLPPLVPK